MALNHQNNNFSAETNLISMELTMIGLAWMSSTTTLKGRICIYALRQNGQNSDHTTSKLL